MSQSSVLISYCVYKLKEKRNNSIFFKASLSLICIFIDDVLYLLYMTMLSEYIFIGATVAGLLWLRRTRPNADRPMKVTHLI